MVDLNLPKPNSAVDEMPKPGIDARSAGAGKLAIAHGLSDLAGGIDAVGVPIAEKQAQADAQKLITRNPDGSLNVENPGSSFIMGKMGEAYNHAMSNSIGVAERSKMDSDLAQMAQTFKGDPQQFRIAAGNYIDARKAQGGPIGETAARYGDPVATQHYTGLVDSAAKRDLSSAASVNTSRLKMVEDNLDGLTGQGDTSSEQYKSLLKERDGLLTSMTSNPLFGYNGEQRKVDDELFHVRLGETAAVSMGRAEYAKSKNIAAATHVSEDAVNALPISQDRKIALIGKMKQNIMGDAAIDGQEKADLRDRAGAAVTLAQQEGRYDATTFANMKNDARRMKLYNVVNQLEAEETMQKYRPLLNSTDPAVRAAAMQEIRAGIPTASRSGGSGGTMPVGGFDAAMNRTFREEGGLNPRDTNGTPSNFGVNQAANPDVDVRNLTKDQAKELYRKRYWNTIGGDYLPPQLAHVAFDTAVIAGPQMAKDLLNKSGGDPNKFMELREQFQLRLLEKDPDKYGKYGRTWANRNANLRADIGADPSTVSSGGTADTGTVTALRSVMRESQTIYNKNFTSLISDIEDGYKTPGYRVAADQLRAAAEMLPNVSDQKTVDKWNEIKQIESVRGEIAKLPVGQMRQLTETFTAMGEKGELSPVGRKTLERIEADTAADTKLAQEDPISFAQRRMDNNGRNMPIAPPGPLDLSTPDGLQDALRQRQRWLGVAKEFDGETSNNPFTGGDVGTLTRSMPNLPADQVANLLSTMMKTLTPEQLSAVMQNGDFRKSIVGLTQSGDPDKMGAAYTFLDSQQRQNPVKFEATYGKEMGTSLALWQSQMQYLPKEEIAKRMMRADDPSVRAGRKALYEEGIKEAGSYDVVKEMKPETSLLTGPAFPFVWAYNKYNAPGDPASTVPALTKAALQQEFAQSFADFYSRNGKKDEALDFAKKQISQKWGQSGINNGSLMAYPPEKHYPMVDGSHDYIKQQLDDAVRSSQGLAPADASSGAVTKYDLSQRAEMPASFAERNKVLTPEEARTSRIVSGAKALQPDEQTQADIAAGRHPSYQVIVTDPDGRFQLLQGKDGRPMRFFADPESASAPVRERRNAADANVRAREEAARENIQTAVGNIAGTGAKLGAAHDNRGE